MRSGTVLSQFLKVFLRTLSLSIKHDIGSCLFRLVGPQIFFFFFFFFFCLFVFFCRFVIRDMGDFFCRCISLVVFDVPTIPKNRKTLILSIPHLWLIIVLIHDYFYFIMH